MASHLTPHGRSLAIGSIGAASLALVTATAIPNPIAKAVISGFGLAASVVAKVSDDRRRSWSRVAQTISQEQARIFAAQMARPGALGTATNAITPALPVSTAPGLEGEIERFFAERGLGVGAKEMPPAPAFHRVGLVLGRNAQGKPIDPGAITPALLSGLQLQLGLDRPPAATISSLGMVLELPRKDREIYRWVAMDLARPDSFVPHRLFGVDMNGAPVTAPLTEVVGSLSAGESGSGKTSWDTAAMATLCDWYSPDEIEIWPADFQGGASFELETERIPHVTRPVTKDPMALLQMLAELDAFSEERLALYAQVGVKSWAEYRAKFPDERHPYVVCWIEEGFSYLQSTSGKALAKELSALASRIRKTGIALHLVIQSPNKKALPDDFAALRDNLPTRHVGRLESALGRAILGESSIPTLSLLGKGDSLLQCPSIAGVVRVQGLLVAPEDRGTITDRIAAKWGELKPDPVAQTRKDLDAVINAQPTAARAELLPTDWALDSEIRPAERARVLEVWRGMSESTRPSQERLVTLVWDVSKGGGITGKNAAYRTACVKACQVLKEAHPKGWQLPNHWRTEA
jgi:hypothetical protein